MNAMSKVRLHIWSTLMIKSNLYQRRFAVIMRDSMHYCHSTLHDTWKNWKLHVAQNSVTRATSQRQQRNCTVFSLCCVSHLTCSSSNIARLFSNFVQMFAILASTAETVRRRSRVRPTTVAKDRIFLTLALFQILYAHSLYASILVYVCGCFVWRTVISNAYSNIVYFHYKTQESEL